MIISLRFISVTSEGNKLYICLGYSLMLRQEYAQIFSMHAQIHFFSSPDYLKIRPNSPFRTNLWVGVHLKGLIYGSTAKSFFISNRQYVVPSIGMLLIRQPPKNRQSPRESSAMSKDWVCLHRKHQRCMKLTYWGFCDTPSSKPVCYSKQWDFAENVTYSRGIYVDLNQPNSNHRAWIEGTWILTHRRMSDM